MNYTKTILDVVQLINATFVGLFDFFSSDLGELTGLSLLNGFSVMQSMFGAGLVTVLVYTLVKWVTGIIT